MEQQYHGAAAIDGRGKEVFKTDRATYDSLSPLGKLIADACIQIGTLVIVDRGIENGR